MLLPTLSMAKEKARSISCINNLKQIGTSLVMYSDDNADSLIPVEYDPRNGAKAKEGWPTILFNGTYLPAQKAKTFYTVADSAYVFRCPSGLPKVYQFGPSSRDDLEGAMAWPYASESAGKRFHIDCWYGINGSTGNVYEGDLPVVESEIIQVIQGKLDGKKSDKYQRFAVILSWADRLRTLRVRANADVPDQAKIARGFGAEGIGLCRTEHMFFAEDRIPIMQKMILARTKEEREKFLDQLLPLQKKDFIGLYREMAGYPVTIRLLDPPLHEFLPHAQSEQAALAEQRIRAVQ
jgi:hypothetical protein